MHGPWPPPARPDPSNRVSGKPEAIAFGEQLFYEPRLSGTGSVLCATCHAPFRQFQDARPRAFGLEEVDRNTPTLLNVRFNRWFGWDGANDTLWKQSLRPLLDAREMRSSPAHVANAVRTLFSPSYEKAFSRPVPRNDEEVLADVGKALAAYQETLVSRRSAFDDFRDALERGDAQAMARYPLAAKRGLRLFEGKGNCGLCHVGPRFTNGDFADIGISSVARKGAPDRGRHGQFRVPSLRNTAITAPYMHDGSIATLKDVALYYSAGKILGPLHLSDAEASDLVSFLESLTSK